MDSEIRSCQNCKQNFTVESEDFVFYEKLKVPAPTFCPECRFMRKIAFRNERNLYKRKCDLCDSSIIAMYPEGTTFPVYCNSCWYSDKWDVSKFFKEYDFSKNFFVQFKELSKVVPRTALIGSKNTNSPYVNYSAEMKNCHLCVGCGWVEDSSYIYRTIDSKDIVDGLVVIDSEQTYENVNCTKNSKLSFSQNTENSFESSFLYNCKNLSNCIGCVNLRNKNYNIFNQQYDKEEYSNLVEKDYDSGSFSIISKTKEKMRDFIFKFPQKFSHQIISVNSTGDDLIETKNCTNCFSIKKGEYLKNCFFGSGLKDSQDLIFADDSELSYDSSSMQDNYKKLFSLICWFSREINYCDLCFSSSNCFGCIGLRNKQYCILNKQYTKEEYEKLVPQIIEQMNSIPYISLHKDLLTGAGQIYKYGEFFPPEISPFAYNETIAQEYFPLTKEQALEKNYSWKDAEGRNIKIDLRTEELKDHIKDVDDSVLKQVIECAHKGECNEQCTTAFKIIPQELEFYRKMNLPLPRLCPNCRHAQRIKQRNPLKLWKRKCMCMGNQQPITDNLQQKYINTATHSHGDESCPNEFETTYAPDRPEIVYCEQCYQAEVA